MGWPFLVSWKFFIENSFSQGQLHRMTKSISKAIKGIVFPFSVLQRHAIPFGTCYYGAYFMENSKNSLIFTYISFVQTQFEMLLIKEDISIV